MIKILYAFHTGGNFKYVDKVLRTMGTNFDVTPIKAVPFLNLPSTDGFDVLIYQTFPDEFQREKFNPGLVRVLDRKFLAFKGLKILLDAHDWPQKDAFTRFNGEYPRIKHMASDWYKQHFNVVMTFPFVVLRVWRKIVETPRPIKVHCAFKTGCYPHRIRETILDLLHRSYEPVTCFDRIPLKAYEKFLLGVQISVTADGTGASAATIQTLLSGALLFVHEHAVKGIQILPHADLVDLEDMVTFNFDNFHERLNWLLTSPADVERIRKSGQQKFFKGYDIGKSAEQLRTFIYERLGRNI